MDEGWKLNLNLLMDFEHPMKNISWRNYGGMRDKIRIYKLIYDNLLLIMVL